MTAPPSTPGPPLVVSDDQLRSSVAPSRAVTWMREAVLAAEAGRLTAPARIHTELGDGRLVFTTGSMSGEWFGYRSYDTFDVEPGQQVVVIHSADTGLVRGIAIGNSLGRMRTGALGGVAVDLLARPDATRVGIIGTGHQAWTQLWAVTAVRDVSEVSVHSRTTAHAEAFATRARDELGVHATVVGTAETATRDQDIVVVATNSAAPVIEASWLSPGTHVTTVGPKQQGASEFGLDLVEAADVVVSDSVAQLHAYDPPSIVATSRHAERVLSLGAVASAPSGGRTPETGISLYLSVGLAGTEVHLLDRVVSHLRAAGPG